MELRYLEIFCKVVELGSFSKAAESLCLTQPTVSIHIKSLEDMLSIKLIDRLGRTIVPTTAGRILYEYAKKITRLRDEAGTALEQFSGKISGTLAIGTSTIPGEFILPGVISRLKAAYPDIYPVLRIADTKSIYELVLQAEADVGVVGYEIKNRNIVIRKYLEDELVLVGPPGTKKTSVTRQELTSMPVLQREAGSGSRSSLEKSLKSKGVKVEEMNVIGEVGSTHAMINTVACGMGCAFISRLAVREPLASGRLREISVDGLKITRDIYIITHRMKSDTPLVKTFLKFIASGD